MALDAHKVAGGDKYVTSDEDEAGSDASSEDDSSSADQGVYHPSQPEAHRGLFPNVGFTLVFGICVGSGHVTLA